MSLVPSIAAVLIIIAAIFISRADLIATDVRLTHPQQDQKPDHARCGFRNQDLQKTFYLDGIWSDLSTIRSILQSRGNWRELRDERHSKNTSNGNAGIARGISRNHWNADFVWTWDLSRVKFLDANPCQLVNHFANSDEIAKKGNLLRNLKKNYKEEEVFSFHPRAYLLSDPEDRKRFIDYNQLWQKQQQRGDDDEQPQPQPQPQQHDVISIESDVLANQRPYRTVPNERPPHKKQELMWIVKAAVQERGTGITITSNVTFILDLAPEQQQQQQQQQQRRHKQETTTTTAAAAAMVEDAMNASLSSSAGGDDAPVVEVEAYVAQQYVEQPLLYQGRKFDIRQFVLVTSLNPLVVFMYDDCYLRLSAFNYTNRDSYDNKFIHLTNHQIQKQAGLTKEELADTIKTCDEFQESLRDMFGDNATRVYHDVIRKKMKEATIKALKTWPAEGHRDNSFEIFGLDILIDEELNVWLLEINKNPGLYMTTPKVINHHTNFLKGLFSVVLDHAGGGKESEKVGSFELIYSGEVGPPQAPSSSITASLFGSSKKKSMFTITKKVNN